MQWQDIILAIVQWIFAIALLPTLRSADKPPLSTSIPTGIAVLVLAFTFATLGLWNGAASTFIVGSLWLTIGWQKWKTRSDEKAPRSAT